MYKISDFSKKVGLSPRMLRHYESLGLINPSRVGKDYRSYSEEDLHLVSKIQFFQQLGFSLKEVKEILEKGVDKIHNDLLALCYKKEKESETIKLQIEQICHAVKTLSSRPVFIDELINIPTLSIDEREEILKASNLMNREVRGRAPLFEFPIVRLAEELSNNELKYKIVSTDLMYFEDVLKSLPSGYSAIYECLQGHSFFYFHCSEKYSLQLFDEVNVSAALTFKIHSMEVMSIWEKWWGKAYFPVDFSFSDLTTDARDLHAIYGPKEVVISVKIEVNSAHCTEYIYLGLPAPYLLTVNNARLWDLYYRSNGNENKVLEILSEFYTKDTIHYIMEDLKKVVG